jgi:hypothetical protein
MTLPVDQLYRTTVVVRDLGAAAREYADFYGISHWQVAQHDGFVAADGTNDSGGLRFQLIEPGQASGGIYAAFLRDCGEGIHSFCVTRVAGSGLPALRDELEALGADLAARWQLGDSVETVLFDTRELLGGFMVEVAVADDAEWLSRLRSDETWDLSGVVARPKDLDFVKTTEGLNHFGVVVPDLQAVLPNYARLFGTKRWRGYHWHTGEGSLDEATYFGAAVEHGFSTARGDVGKDRFGRGFGFEIVQPDFGPTHFGDFLDARSAAGAAGGAAPQSGGIHHLSLNLRMKDAFEWVEFQRWMATLGPVCMSGWLRDQSAMYNYSDLSASIGHFVESGIRRLSGHVPDRWY